jgi:fucose 4-O-acetylase-like acetyltransferase
MVRRGITSLKQTTDNGIRERLFAAKGIGIALVVIGHVDLGVLQPASWTAIREIIYTFHMPLFMVVSGILFAMTQKQIASLSEYHAFLKKKAARLLVPYATITMVLLAVKLAASAFFTLSRPVAGNLLYFVFLNPLGGFSNILWFIYTLFVIFLLFPVLRFSVKNDLVLMAVTILLSLFPWTQAFCLDQAFLHLPFFTAGYVLYRMSFFDELRPLAGIATPLVIYVFVFALRSHVSGSFAASRAISILLGVTGGLACITAAAYSLYGPPVLSRMMTILGVSATGIYLLHTIAMGAVKIFLTQVMQYGESAFLPIAVAMAAAGLALPLIIERYVIRRSSVASRLILGVKGSSHAG